MKEYKYNKSFGAIRENIEDTSYGICPSPLNAQEALNILCDYLLGDDWYCVMSMGVEQVNAVIVEQILDKYSKQWRKDWKNYEKETENK
jgi:hypothetical protein